jgi:hypothetical protein
MTRPDLASIPDFYKRYVERVQNYDVLEALAISSDETVRLIESLAEEKGDYRYAAGKWSIKELFCHTIDTERIMSYRALRFARNDRTPLAGFDENTYTPESNAESRSLKSIANEMVRLRLTTIDLFASFTPAMLERTGLANEVELSVLNLGYIISGHESHHRAMLKERYLSLTQ